MSIIIRTTLKLLFRNKGFWFFLLIAPALSVLIYSLNMDSLSMYLEHDNNKIIEIEDDTVKAAYVRVEDTFCVKVYDASGTALSEYMLNKLTKSGMFSICRQHTNDMTLAEADKRVDKDTKNDTAGAFIYLSPDFDRLITEGKVSEAFKIYITSEDDRYNILDREIKNVVSDILDTSAEGLSADDTAAALAEKDALLPEKEVVSLAGKNEVSLTAEQTREKTRIGYAFAILSMGFIFSGIFVAHSVIEEQKDKVLLRIDLTGTKSIVYFAAKFITSIITSVMLTTVLLIYSVIAGTEFSMGIMNFILMVFLMGFIFSSLSLLLGVVIGNAMSANYAAFTIWAMSSLLSGLYFPLGEMKNGTKMLSYMMPQRWFMDSTDLIFTGDNKGYFMVLCITAAYLLIIISLGGVGLKLKKNEA